MSHPPTTGPTPPAPDDQRLPSPMTYGIVILVGCCLCASLLGSLL